MISLSTKNIKNIQFEGEKSEIGGIQEKFKKINSALKVLWNNSRTNFENLKDLKDFFKK